MSDLAKKILDDRKGDPAKAKTPNKGAKTATTSTASKKVREEADPALVEKLAGVLADGEAGLGALFVPEKDADRVHKSTKGMLKSAWEYHFIQHGINGFPSWAVLLVAHLGLLAAVFTPNKDRFTSWVDGAFSKLTGKPKKVVESERTTPKAPAQDQPANGPHLVLAPPPVSLEAQV